MQDGVGMKHFGPLVLGKIWAHQEWWLWEQGTLSTLHLSMTSVWFRTAACLGWVDGTQMGKGQESGARLSQCLNLIHSKSDSIFFACNGLGQGGIQRRRPCSLLLPSGPGPWSFSLSALSTIQSHGFKYHLHSDDEHIYISSPEFSPQTETYISNHLLNISAWMSDGHLYSSCPKWNSWFSHSNLLHPQLSLY